MARQKGANNFAGTLEVLAGGPLDAREVVPTKADLLVNSNAFLAPRFLSSIINLILESDDDETAVSLIEKNADKMINIIINTSINGQLSVKTDRGIKLLDCMSNLSSLLY